MPDTEDRRSLTMTEVMPPHAANFAGKVHGGYILKLLDTVAYACAARYCNNYAVTLSVDQVFFLKPINVGDLVTFYASVNYVGKTSMEIGIRVVAENLATGESLHTNTCYFTMVAIDENGKSTSVPPLEPTTLEQKRRHEEGAHRRELRMKSAQAHKDYKEKIRKKLSLD